MATLQVCVYTDSINRCKPLLIFHRAVGKGDCQKRDEERKYAYSVNVLQNPKAYANEDTMLYQIKHIYQFSLAYLTVSVKQEPCLLTIDTFTPHLTLVVHCALKAQKTTLSVILGGCTRMIQVLDVSINKLLKDLIREEQGNHYDQHIEDQQKEKYNIRERRILLTYWVVTAQKRLHLEHQDTIAQNFQDLGMTLNTNGSNDAELKVKGIPNIVIGDY